ncbi:MAG: hypothetical protein NUW00_00425 [Candidatus Kaiserbacteria bacterium]|nr:hypothetical protein [Candidatus Kaiserbacteria bacterium]
MEVDSPSSKPCHYRLEETTMKKLPFTHSAGMRDRPAFEIATPLPPNAMADKDRLAANPAPTAPKRE